MIRIMLRTAAVVLLVLSVGTIIAQIGLRFAPAIYTTLIGTAIVSGAMIGGAVLAWKWIKGIEDTPKFGIELAVPVVLLMAVAVLVNGLGFALTTISILVGTAIVSGVIAGIGKRTKLISN